MEPKLGRQTLRKSRQQDEAMRDDNTHVTAQSGSGVTVTRESFGSLLRNVKPGGCLRESIEPEDSVEPGSCPKRIAEVGGCVRDTASSSLVREAEEDGGEGGLIGDIGSFSISSLSTIESNTLDYSSSIPHIVETTKVVEAGAPTQSRDNDGTSTEVPSTKERNHDIRSNGEGNKSKFDSFMFKVSGCNSALVQGGLKIVYVKNVRDARGYLSWEILCKKLTSGEASPTCFSYEDYDGDIIEMSSTEDMVTAVECHINKGKTVLKLVAHFANPTANVPSNETSKTSDNKAASDNPEKQGEDNPLVVSNQSPTSQNSQPRRVTPTATQTTANDFDEDDTSSNSDFDDEDGRVNILGYHDSSSTSDDSSCDNSTASSTPPRATTEGRTSSIARSRTVLTSTTNPPVRRVTPTAANPGHKFEGDKESSLTANDIVPPSNSAEMGCSEENPIVLLDDSATNLNSSFLSSESEEEREYKEESTQAGHEASRSPGEIFFREHLQPYGWIRAASDIIIPAVLATLPINLVLQHGKEGIHYAKGWECLNSMVLKYGELKQIPGKRTPMIVDYDTTELRQLKQRIQGRYEGNPAGSIHSIRWHRMILSLGLTYRATRYFLDGKQGYVEHELFHHFVKCGIPNKEKLSISERMQLEEQVKFAHVDLLQLKNAKNDIDGFSNEILTDEEARCLLKYFGFRETQSGLFASRNGKEMTLEETRIFVRQSECWNEGRRARMKKGDKQKLFSLRLWGATSPAPLPTYEGPTPSLA